MKRIIFLLTVVVASLALVCCGGSSSGSNESARKVDEANEVLVQLLNRFNMCTGGYDSGPVIQLTNEFKNAYEALDEKGRQQLDDQIAKWAEESPDFFDYMVLAGFVEGKESIRDMAYRYYSDWFSNPNFDSMSANERRIRRLQLGLSENQKEEFMAGRARFLEDNHPRARARLPRGL